MKKNRIIVYLITCCIICLIGFLFILKNTYLSTINSFDRDFFISKNIEYDELLSVLKNEYSIPDYVFLKLFCDQKRLFTFKAGKYLLKGGFSFNDIVNELRSPGNRKTINFTFKSSDDFRKLASNLSGKTDIDSVVFMNLISSFNYDSAFNKTVSLEEIQSFFIPNTYNIYWDNSEKDFINRMIKEYKNFWSKRITKANHINLSPFEVMILASIVEKESNNISEMADIASLYLNRINRNMKLQADPTINYCFQQQYDFDTTLTRVLNRHLKIDCKYNTYIYQGVPPGLMCMPSINSIDAILNNKSTDFLYMCARAEINEKSKKICFFDSHIFSKTYFNHKKNAKKYQKAIHKYQNNNDYEICFPNRKNCSCR